LHKTNVNAGAKKFDDYNVLTMLLKLNIGCCYPCLTQAISSEHDYRSSSIVNC